ncbi:hypothetical protein D3C72_1198260 [compost metagenome]
MDRHPLYGPGQREHHGEVARDGRGIGPDHGQRVVQEGVAPFRRVGVIQAVSQRGPGHGGLLGGQREVRKVDHQEAARVVQRRQQPFEELVQVQRQDEELQIHREHHDEAAAQRRFQHRQVLDAVARDVVFAGLGRAFHHPARQLRERRAHQVADAVARLGGPDQLGGQVYEFVALSGVHPYVQQQFDARQAQLHAFDLKHDVDRHAVFCKLVIHALRGRAATVQQRAKHVQAARVDLGGRVGRAVTEFGHGGGQRKERRVLDRTRQARSNVLAQAGGAHLADQHLDTVDQGLFDAWRKRIDGRRRRDGHGVARAEHGAHAGQRVVVQCVDPFRVATTAEHQREQAGHVTARGGRRQQARLHAVPELVPEAGVGGHARVA